MGEDVIVVRLLPQLITKEELAGVKGKIVVHGNDNYGYCLQ